MTGSEIDLAQPTGAAEWATDLMERYADCEPRVQRACRYALAALAHFKDGCDPEAYPAFEEMTPGQIKGRFLRDANWSPPKGCGEFVVVVEVWRKRKSDGKQYVEHWTVADAELGAD